MQWVQWVQWVPIQSIFVTFSSLLFLSWCCVMMCLVVQQEIVKHTATSQCASSGGYWRWWNVVVKQLCSVGAYTRTGPRLRHQRRHSASIICSCWCWLSTVTFHQCHTPCIFSPCWCYSRCKLRSFLNFIFNLVILIIWSLKHLLYTDWLL